MEFSKKFGIIKSNILMELDEAKNKMNNSGKNVINFSIGTPDLPPDNHVINAFCEAAKNPENYKYGMCDSPQLIDAVINWYKNRYSVNLTENNITSVNGSQEGIAHIAFPLCDYNDIVLVPNPSYPIFSFGPFLAGAKVVPIPLLEENNYLIDFDSIDKALADKAKMIVVSYPNNPVTATANEDFYERLVFFAKKHDIIVIHDNAYSELIFDTTSGISFLNIKGALDVGIEFNSLSKTYNLTGLRISFALGNKDIIKHFKAFRSQIDYGINFAVQSAAIAALTGPQDIIKRNRNEYLKRRTALCDGLNNIGWKVPYNKGTMFTWFPIPNKFKNSTQFTFELLEKAEVLCVPGISFGSLGEGYIRMALVQPVEIIEKAINQIDKSNILK